MTETELKQQVEQQVESLQNLVLLMTELIYIASINIDDDLENGLNELIENAEASDDQYAFLPYQSAIWQKVIDWGEEM